MRDYYTGIAFLDSHVAVMYCLWGCDWRITVCDRTQVIQPNWDVLGGHFNVVHRKFPIMYLSEVMCMVTR